MSGQPTSPKVLKGAFLKYHGSPTPKRFVFQYNPATLTRTLLPQDLPMGMTTAAAHRPFKEPVETISLEIEMDATDQLEHPDENPHAVQAGIYPQLAALESLMRPWSKNQKGLPYLLFAWGTNLLVPIVITSYLVTEELFDTNLNPIRAKATVQMRVLGIGDIPLAHPAILVYFEYLTTMEGLAALGFQ